MVIKCVSYVCVGGTANSFHHYLVRFGYDSYLMIDYLDIRKNISTILDRFHLKAAASTSQRVFQRCNYHSRACTNGSTTVDYAKVFHIYRYLRFMPRLSPNSYYCPYHTTVDYAKVINFYRHLRLMLNPAYATSLALIFFSLAHSQHRHAHPRLSCRSSPSMSSSPPTSFPPTPSSFADRQILSHRSVGGCVCVSSTPLSTPCRLNYVYLCYLAGHADPCLPRPVDVTFAVLRRRVLWH
jgi:hypothetical protein